ncbi:MAG TPA: hypothetical protein VEY87_08090 [Gaiellaceae bacterium]|nr:hypothetical protein [Gaiellaceae bacterium]
MDEHGYPVFLEPPPGPKTRAELEAREAAREQRRNSPSRHDRGSRGDPTAVVSFAPAYDTRHVTDDRAGAPDLMVGSDALKKVRLDEPVPVVVDHNREHVVGQVRNFWVHEDVDLGTRCRRWWFASCHLTEAPSWLKRGGGVSWSYNLLSAYDLDGISIITSCLFREVSLLTPATQPAEPLACVMLLKREAARTSAPAVGPDRLAADEIIDDGILRRPAIGRVLAVR